MPQFGYQTLGFGGGASEVKYGPPAVDATSVDTDATGATSQTLSHTVGTGVGRALIVGIMQTNTTGGGSPALPSGVTYDGTAMTRLGFFSDQDYEHLRGSIWYLVAPASGTANIVASFSATTGGASSVRAISVTGVKQESFITAQQVATHNIGSNTSTGATLTGLTAGQLVIDFIAIGDGDATPPSSLAHTSSVGTVIGATESLHGGRYVASGGSSQALAWDWTGGSNHVWMSLKLNSDVYS